MAQKEYIELGGIHTLSAAHMHTPPSGILYRSLFWL